MSESQKPAVDPKAQPAEGNKDKPKSQPEHWTSSLQDENLKKNADVVSFTTIDALAEAYVKLNTKLASDTTTSVKPLTDEASYEDTAKTAEAMLNVKKDAYTEEFKHKDLAFKHKLPAKLIEPFFKDLEADTNKASADANAATLEKYKEEISAKIDDKTLETRMDAGLKALGMTRNSYKELLPELERNKPELVLAIAELGKKQYTTKQQQILDGKDDDLPTDPEILRSMISDLSSRQLTLSMSGQDTFHIDKELRNVKLKFNQVNQSVRPSGVTF